MSMRELPFGARVADSFVKKLKWETVKARDESPGVLPCLCVEERQRHVRPTLTEGRAKLIDFEERPTIPGVNRLAPPPPSGVILVTERAWVLCFDTHKYPPEATFEIDGLVLHVSERDQAELKDSIIQVVNDKIVVNYEPI